MLIDKLNTLFGIIKLKLFILFYLKNVKVGKHNRIKKDFHIIIDKKSKLIIGNNFRCKYGFKASCLYGGILEIGNNVFINNNCDITAIKRIKIGNNVLIGHNFFAIDHDHDYKNNIKNFVSNDIEIGNNVWIGANVTILKGVHIGDNCVIAANTLVSKNIQSNCIIKEKKEYAITMIGEKNEL